MFCIQVDIKSYHGSGREIKAMTNIIDYTKFKNTKNRLFMNACKNSIGTFRKMPSYIVTYTKNTKNRRHTWFWGYRMITLAMHHLINFTHKKMYW